MYSVVDTKPPQKSKNLEVEKLGVSSTVRKTK